MGSSQEHEISLDDLVNKVASSEVILIVTGAGLSRPSGLPTFRDDPAFWGGSIERVATKKAFDEDPKFVWGLYERFQTLARDAMPNDGHFALARLAKVKPRLLTVSQNIDSESNSR